MNTIVSQRTLSVHKEHEFLAKLEALGLNDDLAQKVIGSKDNVLGVKVIRLIANGGFEPSTSQKRAREITSINFFGVEEAIAHFGVNPTKQQSAYLAEIPFSKEVLTACRDTHMLIAVFPLSILEIRGKVAKDRLFYNTDWYNNQAFAKEHGEVGWHLVRKTPVENSTRKTWNEQQTLLGENEETPSARVMVYTIIGQFKARGERLFERIYVRCSDLDSVGCRVRVGHFDADGLRVGNDWDDSRLDRLGLSSARKSN